MRRVEPAADKCERPLCDGKGKWILGILERAHARNLGNRTGGTGRLVVRGGTERRLHKFRLRDHVERAPMRQQHIHGTEQLAARRQATAGLTRSLCHGTHLPPPLVEHRQDQVGFLELGLVEDEHLRAICARACH